MHIKRVDFLDINFDRLTFEDVKRRLEAVTPSSRYSYVVTPNVDHVVRLHREPRLRDLYDAADLCVTALLEPQTYANSPIVYPPGFERLSQQQIADIISEETGRDVRYQYITPDEWTRQLKAAAVHSGGLVNDAMIQHLPTHARAMADNTSIAQMDPDPAALASASGRPPLTFRKFVRQHRTAFGALTATA